MKAQSELNGTLNQWIEVYKNNNNDDDLPEVWFIEIKDMLLKDGYSEIEIDNSIDNYFKNIMA